MKDQDLKPTILIVEDHEAVRASLIHLLKTNLTHSRLLEAKTGEEAIALVRAHKPEIVLMNIGLPKMSGIETTRHIKTELPETKVVVMSIHEAPNYQADADAVGASEFLLKREIPSKLIPLFAELLFELSEKTSGD
jgi:two-component system response regulator DegU